MTERVWEGNCYDAGMDAAHAQACQEKPELESEIDYLLWRAEYERTLARNARNPRAALAHRYLAAAYAARVAEVTATPSDMEDMLREMP